MKIQTDERGIQYIENADAETMPRGWVWCGYCFRAWNDAKPTSWTPAPSGRCPFEADHIYED